MIDIVHSLTETEDVQLRDQRLPRTRIGNRLFTQQSASKYHTIESLKILNRVTTVSKILEIYECLTNSLLSALSTICLNVLPACASSIPNVPLMSERS